MSAGRAFTLRVLLLAIAIALFLGTGEAALRVIYRDSGKRTLGGPGGRGFEYTFREGEHRFRNDRGAKKPGVPRILILGDSVTYGQGVRNWEDVWPEVLARRLEQARAPHEISVLAMPGRDIPAHVAEIESDAANVQPDVFIYQWYVNDIEVDQHRPSIARWWHTAPWHERLRKTSYLYYFLDNRAMVLLPPPDRSYVQYILEDYIPGSLEWAEFERYFHRLATRAKEMAPTRVLVLYPQVPYRGTSPLAPITARLAAMSEAHRLAIPPAAWIRSAGRLADRADAPWRQAVGVTAGVQGTIIETRDYYLPAGDTEIVLTLAADPTAPPATPLGTLDLIDAASGQVVKSTPFASAGSDRWQQVTLREQLPDRGRAVRIRVWSAGAAAFSLGAVEIPVDYGFKIVDLTEPLNAFDTHASIFDSHPNERAHQVIADNVFEALKPSR